MIMEKLSRCPFSERERKTYGRCLIAEMDGLTCGTCPLRPSVMQPCSTMAPVCTQKPGVCRWRIRTVYDGRMPEGVDVHGLPLLGIRFPWADLDCDDPPLVTSLTGKIVIFPSVDQEKKP